MLERETVTVTISGKNYTVELPTRRRARSLMAGVLRILPKMQAAFVSLRATGLPIGNEDEIKAAAVTLNGDAAACMLELYDPLCDWLLEAVPALSESVIDDAEETELINAFHAVRALIERPLSRSGNAPALSTTTLSNATPPISTNCEPTLTPNGNQESTK